MILKVNEKYVAKFSNICNQMRVRLLGSHDFAPMDYLQMDVRGILMIRCEMPGPFEGAKTFFNVQFEAARSFKFQRMMEEGCFSVEIENGPMFRLYDANGTPAYEIPLSIVGM